MMFGMGFGLIGLVVLLVLFVALIAGAGLLVRRGQLSGPGQATAGEGSARELLDQRYARGELTREDYQSIKRELAD